jgi:hypothetical protein
MGVNRVAENHCKSNAMLKLKSEFCNCYAHVRATHYESICTLAFVAVCTARKKKSDVRI